VRERNGSPPAIVAIVAPIGRVTAIRSSIGSSAVIPLHERLQ
jgi:hypothetical protein